MKGARPFPLALYGPTSTCSFSISASTPPADATPSGKAGNRWAVGKGLKGRVWSGARPSWHSLNKLILSKTTLAAAESNDKVLDLLCSALGPELELEPVPAPEDEDMEEGGTLKKEVGELEPARHGEHI